MPAPIRATHEDMVMAAREILEGEGPDAVTMSSVAARLGIRPPSLYKKVGDRQELLALVAESVAAEVLALFEKRADPDLPARGRLESYARIYRKISHESPRALTLLFLQPAADSPAISELLRVLLQAVAEGSDSDPLPSARTLTSWLFGFCTLESSGAFRSGGDVDEAFERGLATVLEG